MKICECYKKQILKELEKNEINFEKLIPECEHKEKIIKTIKFEIIKIISNYDSSLLTKIIGVLK